MNYVHSFLDRSSVPTWKYERAVRVAMETILLVACAAPVVTGWRSLLAQIIVCALRLHQAEVGREKVSINGRHAEQFDVLAPSCCVARAVGSACNQHALPPHKAARIRILDSREAVIAWIWPVLVPLVAAAEANAWTWSLGIGIVATFVRVLFDKWAMPTWRASRVEWRKTNFKQRRAVGRRMFDLLQKHESYPTLSQEKRNGT